MLRCYKFPMTFLKLRKHEKVRALKVKRGDSCARTFCGKKPFEKLVAFKRRAVSLTFCPRVYLQRVNSSVLISPSDIDYWNTRNWEFSDGPWGVIGSPKRGTKEHKAVYIDINNLCTLNTMSQVICINPTDHNHIISSQLKIRILINSES